MLKTIKTQKSNYFFDTNTLRLFKDKVVQGSQEIASYENEKILYKLVFNVANTCNLRCRYCYANCGNYGRENNLMTESVAKEIILSLKDQYDKIKTVYFFGGEPTTNFKVIKFATQLLNKYFTIQDYRIVTNATLVDDEMIDFFVKNNFKVYVSIDGPKDVNDFLRGSNFQKVTSVINKLKNSPISNKLELICTYTKYHQDKMSFDDLVKFFEGLNVKYSISDVITDDKMLKIKKSQKQMIEQEKDYIDKSIQRILNNESNVGISQYIRNIIDAIVYKEKAKVFCGELINSYSRVYDYNGDIYPCIRLIGTHKSGDKEIEKANNKSNAQCKSCWAYNICKDCVADVVLGNVKACYLYSRCYKKSLYNYALKRVVELYDQGKDVFDKFIKNFFLNYLF